ncbi:MAG: pyrrolo-quinoline quinone, partial [Sphingomonas hengshuiensis]
RLIVVNSLGRIASVKADTGEVGTVIKGSGPFALPPVIANNVLYVLDQKGQITAYR